MKMKKLFVIAVLLWVTGCSAFRQISATGVANKAYIGMSVEEFQKLSEGRASVEAMTADYVIYRMSNYGSYKVGEETKFYDSSYKYFHFDSDGHLFKIESREMPDPNLVSPHFPGGHGGSGRH